jgi:regulator of protease activity HflC (stomatin/prohibitin superfamily)
MSAQPSDDDNGSRSLSPIAGGQRQPQRVPVQIRPRTIGIGLAALALLILGYQSFYTIAEYERGVLTTWGQFDSVVNPGLHFRLPIAQRVWRYPINIRQVTIERANTYTIDNQEIDATVTIFYRLPPNRLEFIYRNVPDYEQRVVAITIDRFKSELGKVNTSQVAQKRGEVRDHIKEVLSATVQSTTGVEIVDLQIPNIDYTQSFRAAVDQAAVAKTLVEKQEQQKLQAQIAAEQRRIEAAGVANAAREEAGGQADAKLLQAKADAEAIRLRGEAEAMAIKAQAAALRENPNLIELRKVERWNGSVPQWNGTGPLPLLNLSGGPEPSPTPAQN